MPESLPYLTSPGSLNTALERIRAAATPDRVNGDFVSNTLNMKGGTGAAITPYLKKIGFIASDGTPTEIYRKFRNKEHSGKIAAGEAVLFGYKELKQVNEKFYTLGESALKSLIVQITGLASDSKVVKLIYSTLASLLKYADFKETKALPEQAEIHVEHVEKIQKQLPERNIDSQQQVGLNLSYTINLNLPATSDQSVFNAIFRSLKEHLLTNNE